ncbi:phage tail assembly chaperone [Paracoccus sp. Z330]|uniref:Phage tail assembly chaperone n=1 Tax=Paracoccus onchidii TaxID=3017813 RepID=A0ABT4ZF96_9RHOB|nr:rcc01693 family protein [Paracoccus onchidii]MDB6178033.1 phage tail assembly chaperone [Paracoccus onchidii]
MSGFGPETGTGIDWAGLMRAGLRGLRLHPDQFWSLTPAELALMLGVEEGMSGMTRSRLAALSQKFPDRVAASGEQNTSRTEV